MKPKTTGRRLTSLRAFVKWAKWPTMLVDYYAPTPLKGDPHPLPEGMEGVRRMIGVATSSEQRSLVAFCGMCGLRISEALSVRPSHFDFSTMELAVFGKGDKSRKVPVTSTAWEYMQDAVGRAFIDGDRTVITFKDRFARGLITTLGERAHLQRRVSSHDLRATFATALYEETLDLRVVQEILGHAASTDTEVYVKASMTKARSAMERL